MPWTIDLCEELGNIIGALTVLSADFPEYKARLDEPLDILVKAYAELCEV